MKGTVPSVDQESALATVLGTLPETTARYEVDVLPVAASDRLDGRGRSPVTGTSADSAHESRRQLDVE